MVQTYIIISKLVIPRYFLLSCVTHSIYRTCSSTVGIIDLIGSDSFSFTTSNFSVYSTYSTKHSFLYSSIECVTYAFNLGHNINIYNYVNFTTKQHKPRI